MLRILGWAMLACGLFLLFLMMVEQAVAARSGVPYWVAERLPDRMAKLRPGMTEPQVMAALGLAGRGVKLDMGSGSLKKYIGGYYIQPGMGMELVLDTTQYPSRFVSGEVFDDGTLRKRAALALGLTIIGGFLAWRGSKLVMKTGDQAASSEDAETQPPVD